MSSIRKKMMQDAVGTKDPTATAETVEALKHFMTHKHGDFLNTPIKDLKPDPEQPRKDFDRVKLQELSDSIKATGILQPILIRSDGVNIWIVAGERRYRAAIMAGLKRVPCIVTKGDPDEISLIENIQREDLKPIELANAFEQMMKRHKYSQVQLGRVIGKSPKTISAVLAIKKLPESIIEDLSRARDGGDNVPIITRRTLTEIARSPPKHIQALYEAAKKGATSDEIRVRRKRAERPITQRSTEVILCEKVDNLTQALKNIEDPNRFNVKTCASFRNLRKELDRFPK